MYEHIHNYVYLLIYLKLISSGLDTKCLLSDLIRIKLTLLKTSKFSKVSNTTTFKAFNPPYEEMLSEFSFVR